MEIVISDHALQRMEERQVPRSIVAVTINHGKSSLYDNGYTRFVLSSKSIVGFPELEQWIGLTVISENSGGLVVTVYRDKKWKTRKPKKLKIYRRRRD